MSAIILGARLDDDLYALLCASDSRDVLRRVLIETYFAPEIRASLLEQGEINAAAYEYSQELLAKAHTILKEVAEDSSTIPTPIRDQGFRRAIVRAYDHRCAICGVRILTADGHTAVAAAHIIPWSISHNDDPRNGLALCHLCHWTFDEGLVTFTDQYQVKTSPQLASTPNLPGHLLTFAGRPLLGPADEALRPFPDSIRWHRKEVFHGR
ncbi:MAG: HNH endonuclease [Anaerolineae bacterium]|nr:HNH endonuclease [Anaerolineae bacterium]